MHRNRKTSKAMLLSEYNSWMFLRPHGKCRQRDLFQRVPPMPRSRQTPYAPWACLPAWYWCFGWFLKFLSSEFSKFWFFKTSESDWAAGWVGCYELLIEHTAHSWTLDLGRFCIAVCGCLRSRFWDHFFSHSSVHHQHSTAGVICECSLMKGGVLVQIPKFSPPAVGKLP